MPWGKGHQGAYIYEQRGEDKTFLLCGLSGNTTPIVLSDFLIFCYCSDLETIKGVAIDDCPER